MGTALIQSRAGAKPPVRVLRIRRMSRQDFAEISLKLARTIEELARGVEKDPATALLLRVLESL